MTAHRSLPASAALALLLVAGCNKSGPTDQASSSAQEALAVSSDETTAAGDTSTGGGATAQPVAVVPVPVPAQAAPAVAAPLVQAAEVSHAIDAADAAIDRVPYQGGWAWRRNGQIVRTASRDGRRVSYFHPGETTPFLVQNGDRAYAYSHGQVQTGYDGHGRPVQVDQSRRHEGEQLAQVSRQDRTKAQQVAVEQPQKVEPERSIHAPKRDGMVAAPDRRSPGEQRRTDSRAMASPSGHTHSDGPRPDASGTDRPNRH